MKKIALLICLSLIIFSACTKDTIEDINGPITETNEICDSITFSYANDVIPALSGTGCFGCHNTANAAFIGDNINLEGYDNFVANLDGIEGSVNRFPGYSPMPQGQGKVSQEVLDVLNCWIAQGAENN